MCFIRSSSDYEDDVVVSSRRVRRAPREVVYAEPGRIRERTRVSQSLIVREPSPPRAQYVPATTRESRSTTVIQHSPPPVRHRSRTRSPPRRSRVEVVSVQQEPRASRGSVGKSSVSGRRGSRHGHETVIERERERERIIDHPRPSQSDFETYRYVEPPARRSRSIIESQPKVSLGRVVERERVLVEDGGRRREYIRRG